MFEYEEAIEEFAKVLTDFIAKYELPDKWFKNPDHLAIKCADGLDYEYKTQDLLPDAQQASEVTLDGRRLAALHLISPQPVGSFGNVSWLEIMQPRPEKQGKGIVGLEHIEFYYPDFSEISSVLQEKGVTFVEQANPGHEWLNIKMNDYGHELKLNNRLLEDIVSYELEEGIAHIL
jgi:predicted metalloenzyme YecM